MLRHALLAAAALLVLPAQSASAAPSEVHGEKAKATKASVLALKAKLEKGRDAIRALAKEVAPKGLTADQKKTFYAEMAKLTPLADGTDRCEGLDDNEGSKASLD